MPPPPRRRHFKKTKTSTFFFVAPPGQNIEVPTEDSQWATLWGLTDEKEMMYTQACYVQMPRKGISFPSAFPLPISQDSPAGGVFDKTQACRASPEGREDHLRGLGSVPPHLWRTEPKN